MKPLEPLINSLIELIKNGTDFVKGQIPEVALEIIRYKTVECFLVLFLCFLASSAVFYGGRYLCRLAREDGDDVDSEIRFAVVTFSIIIELITVIVFSCRVAELLQIWIAPKLFLIEFLKNFLG